MTLPAKRPWPPIEPEGGFIDKAAEQLAHAHYALMHEQGETELARRMAMQTAVRMKHTWSVVPIAGDNPTLIRTLSDPLPRAAAFFRRNEYAMGTPIRLAPLSNQERALEMLPLMKHLIEGEEVDFIVRMPDFTRMIERADALVGLEALATYIDLMWRTCAIIDRWPCYIDDIKRGHNAP